MSASAPPRPPWVKRFRRELRVRVLLLFLPLLARLPHRLAVSIGGCGGWLSWWLLARERRLALDHLAIAFPSWTKAARARAGRASFVNLGRSALELLAADGIQPRLGAVARLEGADAEALRSAYAEGRGVIFITCHIGNWELMARRVVHAGYRAGTVARDAKDPRLTALLERARSRAGLETLWRGRPGLARGLLRLLREGALVGLLIDQDTDVQGQFVPFFGRLAWTPRAAGDLAVRTAAPVVFCCIHREAPTRHRLVVRRISVPATGDRERDSLAVTAAATQAIEQEIRARPDEWVWMHRRWKTQPPAPPPEPPARAQQNPL